MVVSDFEMMQELVLNDAGIGICLESQVQNSQLKRLELDIELPEVNVRAIYNKNTINKPTRALLELINQKFALNPIPQWVSLSCQEFPILRHSRVAFLVVVVAVAAAVHMAASRMVELLQY